MTISRSCSHCQTMNVITEGAAVFCSKCQHRADVPRIGCDCPRCWPVPAGHMPQVTAEGVDMVLPAIPVQLSAETDQWHITIGVGAKSVCVCIELTNLFGARWGVEMPPEGLLSFLIEASKKLTHHDKTTLSENLLGQM